MVHPLHFILSGPLADELASGRFIILAISSRADLFRRGRCPAQEPSSAQILINIRPVNPKARAADRPIPALRRSASSSLGYHTKGTTIVRPSIRSMAKVSLVKMDSLHSFARLNLRILHNHFTARSSQADVALRAQIYHRIPFRMQLLVSGCDIREERKRNEDLLQIDRT